MKKKRTLLVDGNALLFKAFYGTYQRLLNGEERSAKTNEPINAVRTFSLMIMNLTKNYSSEHVLVAFDKGSKTFRHKYDFYKSNRSKQPQELLVQFAPVKEFLSLFGIATLEYDHLEADDIIGIYSKIASKNNFEVDIVTTDRDLLQLVDKNVRVHLAKKGVNEMETYDYENFQDMMQIEPSQVIDLKALMGDSSDNIKGVKGIGPKTAIKLIQEYQCIENIIENVDDLSINIKSKIEADIDLIKLNKKIVSIVCYDEKNNFTMEKIKRKDFNKNDLVSFFNEKSIFNVATKIKSEF